MKIYLIRHGETMGDVEDRYGGDYDDDMTQKGYEQAEELAKELKDTGIEIIFTSPKKRALQTTEVLKNNLNIKNVEIWDDVRERNRYGVLTGMKKQEAKKKYSELVIKVEDVKYTIDGAESYDQLVTRGKAMMNVILDSGYETVAIVTHGGVIGMIMREMLDTEVKKVEDCGYAELEYKDYVLSILRLRRFIL